MTKEQFAEARGELIILLEKQENLFAAVPATEQGGKHLAQAYLGFMEAYTELKKQKVQN
ncbi:hypothetical protein WKR98_13385 [Pigmentiphaga sp. YJ18]|uniref:hypothetical protein n=1 Tax=Pigmentiphaga sp. YJ18 TaxID=3134907 RepID=UPI0031145482